MPPRRAICLFASCCVLVCTGRAFAQNAGAEPSLAQLLTGAPARPDDAAQLVDQLAWLEKRSFARFGAPALNEARAALNSLATLRANKASPEQIERRKELVWSALLLADRLIARAELAAALRVVELRLRQAESDAARAAHARAEAEAALVLIGGATQ
jgi:hypothetical protein